MRRFELVEGSSSKFWQIERRGNELDLAWGRIGTAGQSQTKSFPTEAKAEAEHDKLVAEKTKKGYGEVGAVASTPKPAPATKPAPAAKPAPAPKPAESPKPAARAVDVPGQPAEIRWTPEQLHSLHVVVRGGPLVGSTTDPDTALTAAWAARAKFFDRNELVTQQELGPAVDEAFAFLGGKKAPLSAVGAAVVLEMLALGNDRDVWPVFRAVTDRSLAAFGPGWILDLLKEASTVTSTTGPTQRVATISRGSGDSERVLAQFGLTRITLDEPSYERLCAAVGERLRAAETWSEKAHLLRLVPEATELADSLAEEWLATDGHVSGYQKPSWGNDGIKPELRLRYSHPLAVRLAKKAVGQAFSKHFLGIYLQDLVALYGEGALPMLQLHIDGVDYADGVVSGLGVAGMIRSVPAATVVASQLVGNKEARPVAQRWLEENPTWAAPALALLTEKANALGDAAGAMLLRLDRAHPGLVDGAPMRPASRVAVAKLRERLAVPPDADPADLPAVVVHPPWTSATRPAALPVVEGLAPTGPEAIHWRSGQLDEVLAYRKEYEGRRESLKDIEAEVFASSWRKKHASSGLMRLSDADIRTACAEWEPQAFVNGHAVDLAMAVLGPAVLPDLARVAVSSPATFTGLLEDVESPQLARFFAAARKLKAARAKAEVWLLRFPDAAVGGLLPAGLGKHGPARRDAEDALRWLAARGHADRIRAAAKALGGPAAKAADAVLAFDPRQLLPTKLPKLPAWWAPDTYPRPMLVGRARALPLAAVEAFGIMLAISTPEARYVGVDDVIAVCDPASLEEFSWAVFTAWNLAGANSKEGWAFQQLGALGGDEVARRLTPLIRAWPGESQHARAVSGLDVLARIGSDLALMHLNGVAQKIKFKGLQEKAREKMDEVAAARGLTAADLADRLVPDLDLDEDGSRTLDFGPRQFRVGFDEALKPLVRDDAGKVLTELPKANKADDAALADASTAVWKTLKKDAKAVAANQIVRLELAMCAQRRWEADGWRAMFLDHPLIVHLVRRLIWGVYDEQGTRVGTFRVAEDRTLADADDGPYTLPAGVRVGIVHPLELTDAERGSWGQVLGDYAIVQPFAQLGRDTYAPTAAETKSKALDRRKGQLVPVGKLLGLVERGWSKGAPQDAGWIWDLEKTLPGGVRVSLGLDTGISADMQMTEPKQKLGSLSLGQPLGDLAPVVFSELVRDLVQLGSA